jgi:phosphate-selective porin OprO/OprP
VVGLLLYKDEGKSLVHLGLSLSARKPAGNDVDYSARPEARFAPFFISTGELSANTASLVDLEVAVVHGPFWVQAEFMTSHPDVVDVGTLTFGGAYAEMGWFLTGESRPYRKHDNTFGRVEPIRPLRARGNPFTKGSDGGAIELVGRLSGLDLNDGPIQGGRMHDLSLGINWYMTRANRLGMNYIRSRVEDVGYANIILIRYQFNPGYHWPPLDPRWRHKDADAMGDEKD